MALMNDGHLSTTNDSNFKNGSRGISLSCHFPISSGDLDSLITPPPAIIGPFPICSGDLDSLITPPPSIIAYYKCIIKCKLLVNKKQLLF